jgi:hypothetical protein
MHQKAKQNHQLHDYIVLLQTLQSLEVYQEFCYQLYLFFTTTNHEEISNAKYANGVRTAIVLVGMFSY